MGAAQPLRVAFQGEPGAFSEEAVHALTDNALPLPHHDFAALGEALLAGTADRAVLPVENSIHGSVTAAYDVLASGNFHVLAQTVRAIRLCLAAPAGASLAGLRRVISHPVALAQCAHYLRAIPHLEVVATYDTAGAAREVADAANPAVGAISSRPAALLYGLHVLASDVQDRTDNQTRFFLVARADADTPAHAVPAHHQRNTGRALVLVELADRPGALVDVLAPFANAGINLCSIQSRPAGTPWTYRFFIELAAPDATALLHALDEVRRRASRVTLLGCFD